MKKLALVLVVMAVLFLVAGDLSAWEKGGLFLPYELHQSFKGIAVAIGDINGDGKNDVVMAMDEHYTEDAFKLFVFLQDSKGRLAEPIKYSTRASSQYLPSSIVVADINSDGKNEVIIGIAGYGIEIFSQNLSGTLTSTVFIPTEYSCVIKVADLNHDGLPDIAGACDQSDVIGIFLQKLDGTLDNNPYTISVGYGIIRQLAVGDINGDGLIDLVVASSQYHFPNFALVYQRSNDTFFSEYYSADYIETDGIAIGDVNNDGLLDVAVVVGWLGSSPKIRMFIQNHFGSFVSYDYASDDIPSGVMIFDINNSGHNAVIVSHVGWGQIGVYLPGKDGKLLNEDLYPIGITHAWGTDAMAIGDINSDGLPDIVVAVNSGLSVLYHAPKNPPVLKITANGMENLTITNLDGLSLSASLVDPAGYADQDTDWWLFMKSPNGFFSYSRGVWHRYMSPFRMQELETRNIPNVAHFSRLPIGTYAFHFCVDTVMDGILDLDKMFCDSTEVNVVRYDPRKVLAIAKNKTVGDQKAVAGNANNRASSFILSATSDLVIQKIYVGVISGAESNLSELSDLSIRDNSVAIGSAVSAPDLSNVFLTNFKMAKGTSKIIDAYLGVKAGTPAGHSWRTSIYAVAGYDAKTRRPFMVSPVPVSGTIIIGQTLAVVQGEITASPSENTPASRLVTFGSQNEPVLTVDFNAKYEGSTIDRLKLSLNDSQNIMKAACLISDVTVKYRDKSGAEQSATSALWYDQGMNVPQAIFTGLAHYTPANSISSLKYYVSFLDFGSSCGSSGVEVKLTLEEFRAVGDSGTEIIAQPMITSKAVYVYKTYPAVASDSLQQTLYNGPVVINKTKIVGSALGFVDWAETTYSVKKSTELSIAGARVYDATTYQEVEGTITIVDLGVGSNTGSITFIPSIPQTVSSNGKTYLLQAEIRGVTIGSFITTWINKTPTYAPSTAYADIVDPNASFIWSDRSAVNHSEITLDWSNGYSVPGLPTVKQTITR